METLKIWLYRTFFNTVVKKVVTTLSAIYLVIFFWVTHPGFGNFGRERDVLLSLSLIDQMMLALIILWALGVAYVVVVLLITPLMSDKENQGDTG